MSCSTPPQQTREVLFILRRGRVRIFRVSSVGRALTCAILTPGTVFGEMLSLGQRMDDSFAEALDEASVLVMDRADVDHCLLSDARIATRIAERLGRRMTELEQRLSDSVVRSAPQRIATTLLVLTRQQASSPQPVHPGTQNPQVPLTQRQLAALAGTSREAASRALRRFADQGLIRLARGRIIVLSTEH